MRKKVLFFGILLLALFFRFYNLSSVPSHPTLDEVSLGYNAYSIIKTGSDEFGNKFPVLLRAYDDYRPALYVYLIIPFIFLFDLSVIAVRLPSAILSTFAVISIYFIMKEIIPVNNKLKELIPFFSMFLASVSPWSVYISRLGHEANAGFSFFIVGLLFFIRFVNSRKNEKIKHFQLIFSSIFFGLSFSSYQSQKAFIPLFVLFISILFFKKLIQHKQIFFISILAGITISLPVLISTFSPDALIRFSGTNIFKSEHPVLKESIERIKLNDGNENIFQKIFDNRRVGYILVFTQGFLSHFDLVWLITNRGGENFKAPDFGLMTFSEGVLIILGIIYLINSSNISKRIKILFVGWLIFSIIPAAITTDYPHAMRSMTVLFLPQIISGFGLIFLLEKLKRKKIILFFVFTVFTINTVWFYHAYFTNFKNEESYRFQHGVIESLNYAKKNEHKFSEIVVSNQGALRASYMYYLFNSKFDPAKYQKSSQNENGRFDTERKIGKYLFTDISKKEIKGSPLFIIPKESLPRENFDILKVIYYLDKKESIWVAVRR